MKKIDKYVLFPFISALIIGLTTVAAAGEFPAATPSGVPLSQLERFVDDYTAEYIGVKTAGASIAVLKDGEIVFSKAYGYAVQDEVKAGRESVFEWGSATKLLVWTSLMQLKEQGKLNLNGDIRDYLPPGFLKKLKYEKPVTIYNLMHHNAGWEDRIADLFIMSPESVKDLEETLLVYEPLQVYPPGTIVAYSNYGCALAGFIVEQISGMPFYEYVNKNIFEPLGMKDTSIHPTQKDNPSVAERRGQIKGHRTGKGMPVPSPNERIYVGLYPAGSVMGTAADASKFLSALMPESSSRCVLFRDNKTLNEMLSASDFYKEGFPRFSHGFMEYYYSARTLGHGGNTDSFSSSFTITPGERFALVIMTNQSGETAICSGLAKLLLGEYRPEYSGELADMRKFGGFFTMARKPETGFVKLPMTVSMTLPVKPVDENTVDIAGAKFVQISPYLLKNMGGNELIDVIELIFIEAKDGKATKALMMFSDLLPTSVPKLIPIFGSLVLLALCVLYIPASLVIIIAGAVRNRKKRIPSNRVKKLNIVLCSSIAAAIINCAFLMARALDFSTYSSLLVHFIVNITYVVFVPVCIGLMVINRKLETRKSSIVFNIFSMAVSVTLAVILVTWEFWR